MTRDQGIQLKVGDVVQIDPQHDEVFGGQFLVVTEPKDWGVQGYCIVMPRGEDPTGVPLLAYYRIKWEYIEYVGKAVWYSI